MPIFCDDYKRKLLTVGRSFFATFRVVNPETEIVTPAQTVVATGSRITWVGDSDKAPPVSSGMVVDGNDRFLCPGLVDMHVHSSSAAGWLLDLNNGVTTVRDMDGFPWLLKLRDSVNARRMLAPIDVVAGTIINAFPLDGYAVVPRTSQDARRIVRQQAACGYDFIKIHNNVPLAMFDAIADQAHKLGMDVVGHVPHDISLDHAIHSGGMRTTEHLKGFLIDQTLLPSDEDFSKSSQLSRNMDYAHALHAPGVRSWRGRETHTNGPHGEVRAPKKAEGMGHTPRRSSDF